MAEQLNELLQPVVTPSGNTITTTASNAVKSAGSAALNTGNVIVGEVGGAVGGIVAGAIGEAVAPVIDVAQKTKQVVDLIQNPSLGGALSLLGRGFPPYRNELNQFASYNYIFTLGALTNLELNFPLSYRTVGPLLKIIKSGGTGGNKVPSIYEVDGMVEFFIEDVEIKNHLAPNPGTRLSNATSIDFKVIEPYSMGQFFHNLRTAALVAGHPNYLQAPFLLSIEFIGYDDEGNVKEPFFSKRHIPIKLVKSDMDVTESGAVYSVKAVPYNETALIDQVDAVTTDVQLKGRTVAELLQTGAESLASKINTLQSEQVSADQKPAEDFYIISFPNQSIIGSLSGPPIGNTATISAGATDQFQKLWESIRGSDAGEIPADLQEKLAELPGAQVLGSPLADQLKQTAAIDINAIGNSEMNLYGTQTAVAPGFQDAAFVENEDAPGTFTRGNITVGEDLETFTFKNATKITDIIEEVVLASNWGRDAIQQKADKTGDYEWFRIHTHVYNSSSLFGGLVTGQSPKIYVYRVVPYRVPATVFSAPTSSSIWDKLGQQSNALKAYNYIYTGENSEIINFDLHFNQSFYTGAQATRAQRNLSQILGGQNSSSTPETQTATTTDTGSANGVTMGQETGSGVARDNPQNQSPQLAGGGGNRDTASSVASQWNETLIHSRNDMITVDLEINGDPYWLIDAGLGNWLGIPNPVNQGITIEGSCNPINNMVTTILNFRTPIDYNGKDGFVKYPLGGFLPIAMFSGVYKVIYVTNNFKNGKFTQTLQLARLRNHDLSPQAIGNAILSAIGGSSVGQAFGLGSEKNRMGGETQTEGS